MYNELNLDTLTVVFRQDARLTVDGDALVGVVSALHGAGRDGGRVASSSLCGLRRPAGARVHQAARDLARPLESPQRESI